MAYSVPGAFILIGIILLLHAATIPQYTDPNWDSREKNTLWQSSKEGEKGVHEWYQARSKVLTSHDRDQEVGMAIFLLGATIAAIFGIQGVWGFESLRRISSPRTRFKFFLTAAVTWLSFAFAMAIDGEWRFERGDYPAWAEPVPIEYALISIFAVFTLPVILVGVQIALWRTPLPVLLASGRPTRNVSITLWILGAILLDVYVFYIGFTEETWVIVPAVVTMYLLLSGRAAANHPNWRTGVSGTIREN